MKKKLSFLLLAFIVQGIYSARAQSTSWVSWATVQAKLDTFKTFCIYIADVNNDKYPDIVTVENWSVSFLNGVRLYMNAQDPASTDPRARIFVDVTATSGVNAKPGGGNSKATLTVALADVNNDGNVDMVKGPYYHRIENYTDDGDRCEVLLGDGQGHFTLVNNNGLHEMGLVNTTGFSFLDYNKDGKIDLFVANWFKDDTKNIWSPGHLLKGNGDGTFTDVSTAAGITTPEPMYGCSAIDWNNDGWPDIATAPYCRTPGQLLRNNKDGTFTDVASTTGYDAQVLGGDAGKPLCMWSNVPEDFDNDGDMDFLYALVHGGNDANEGHSTMVMNAGPSNGYKLSWDMARMTWKSPQSSHHGDYDASWFDLDNDGLEDIVLTQGTYIPATDRLFIFRQQADHSLMDVTQDLGLITTDTKDLHVEEVMDYDLDGDDDIIYCRNGARTLQLIKNEIGHTKNWIGVRLIAPAGVNKDCIGSRIYLWTGGVQRMREVYAGRGNDGGQQPLALLFGLGGNDKIDSIRVQWPDAGGTSTKVTNIPINRYINIGASGLDVKEAGVMAQKSTLKVYPNPATDFVFVQLSNNDEHTVVEIYNMVGQRMQDVAVSASGAAKVCSVKNLPTGTYIIKAIATDGKVYTQPFIKVD